MQPQEQPIAVPGQPAHVGVSRIRDIPDGPAGPVRIEVRLIPRTQLVISGPGIPRVCLDRVETAAERALRERAEAMAAAKGRPPPPAGPSKRWLKTGFSAPELFTRDQKHEGVRLTVAGATAELRPRPAIMVRASYGVRAQVSDRHYLLSQVSRRRARVRRDGQTVAGLRRPSTYKKGSRYADVQWAAGVDPIDVAITHTLASAYRVGSPGFMSNLALGIAALTDLLGS